MEGLTMIISGIHCGNCNRLFENNSGSSSNAVETLDLEITDSDTKGISYLEIFDALAYIYGIKFSWDYFFYRSRYTVPDNSDGAEKESHTTRLKICSICATSLVENYKAHKTFENITHPESIVYKIKTFPPPEKQIVKVEIEESEPSCENLKEEEEDFGYDNFLEDETENDHVIGDNIASELEDVHESKSNTNSRVRTMQTRLCTKRLKLNLERLPMKKINHMLSKTVKRKKIKRKKRTQYKGRPMEDTNSEEMQSDQDFDENKNEDESNSDTSLKSWEEDKEVDTDSDFTSDADKNSPVRAGGTNRKFARRAHQCRQCKKFFPNKKSLLTHKKSHHNGIKKSKKKTSEEGPFTCEICGKVFTSFDHFKYKHMPLHENAAVCHLCGKKFATKSILKHHMFKHLSKEEKEGHKVTCEMCDKVMYSKSLKRHLRIHDQREQFRCSECGKAFLNKHTLKEHMIVHSDTPFKCNICGKTFEYQNSLRDHASVHTGDKPFSCNICHKSFTQKGNLYSHIKDHGNERPYVCDQCGKSFKRHNHLKMHLQKHKDIEENGMNAFKCEKCGRTFMHSQGLKWHTLKYHRPADMVKRKVHECSICGKILSSACVLRAHENLHKPGVNAESRLRNNKKQQEDEPESYAESSTEVETKIVNTEAVFIYNSDREVRFLSL